jgi:N-acetylneuraminic acid mutarotase
MCKQKENPGINTFLLIGCLILICGSCTDDDSPNWKILADMPTARYGLGLVEHNGLLYAIGGYNASGVKSVEVYDPETNSWQAKASMPTGRGFLVLAKANNKIYAIGGITGGNLDNITYLYSNEEYDPITNKWTTKAPLPLNVQAPNNVFGNQFITGAAIDNKIYISGGNAGAPVPTFAYDPITDTWTDVGMSCSFFNNEPYASTSANNELFVIQGTPFQRYNPIVNEWRVLKPLNVPRSGVCLTSSSETIYAVGGSGVDDYSRPVANKVEVYNITNDSWSSASPLKNGRTFPGAVILNHKLFVVGGAQISDYVYVPQSTVEVLELN